MKISKYKLKKYNSQIDVSGFKYKTNICNDILTRINNDIKNIIKYFETLCGMVARLRQNPKLKDSWIQNDIDTVVSLMYRTKYKLVNHQ